MLKNFWKLESFKTNTFAGDSAHGEPINEEHLGDDFEELYGVENEFSRELKDKIAKSKLQKGRGLLLSFYEFN